MTQYLVTTFKDSTGRKHTHITKAKSNQRFTVVEAESKEAKEKYESQNTPIVYYTNNSKVTLFERPSEEVLGSLFEKK